jgi:nucleotide-binding universal stress UspA family protein
MYHRLMVPLDETVDCQRAIPFALTIAAREEAIVELVHVAMPPSIAAQVGMAGMEVYVPPVINAESDAAARASAVQRLETIADEAAGAREVRIESTVLDRSDVARAIAEHAEETKPDLVVMTTHDHSRLERLVLGSVSEAVVRRVNAPVLLVPSTDERPSLSERVSIKHLLVTLDGSDLAAQILPHARAIAEAMGARVSFLTVSEELLLPPPPGLAAFDAALEPSGPDAAAILNTVAEDFRAAGLEANTNVVVARDRADAILDFAHENGVDLIAMSTHGRRGVGRLVAGSVASKVLRKTTIPMMVYRPANI